jgi:hypothetical protein
MPAALKFFLGVFTCLFCFFDATPKSRIIRYKNHVHLHKHFNSNCYTPFLMVNSKDKNVSILTYTFGEYAPD